MKKLRKELAALGLPPEEPPTPGAVLLTYLQQRGLTQLGAARAMEISMQRMNELVLGKRGMTADTAIRLARLLDTSPVFWRELQVARDLWRAVEARHRAA